MAKLLNLPGLAVINGFKGVIDYYVHDGIACARKWPRSPGHKRAPAVEAQWNAFGWAASNWDSLSLEVKTAYKQMAAGTRMSGRDLFVKFYISSKDISLIP